MGHYVGKKIVQSAARGAPIPQLSGFSLSLSFPLSLYQRGGDVCCTVVRVRTTVGDPELSPPGGDKFLGMASSREREVKNIFPLCLLCTVP